MTKEEAWGSVGDAMKIVNSVVGGVQNKKARQQNDKHFQQNLQLQREAFEEQKKNNAFQRNQANLKNAMTIAQSIEAQKDKNRNNYKEKLSEFLRTEEQRKVRARANAFMNGVRSARKG